MDYFPGRVTPDRVGFYFGCVSPGAAQLTFPLVNDDVVAFPAEFEGGGESGGSGSDHGDGSGGGNGHGWERKSGDWVSYWSHV